jgi:hypothetical protein
MGNSLKSEAIQELDGPGQNVAFFQAMNIRWLNVFIAKVKDIKKAELSIDNTKETLKWSDYFRIFTEIKDSMASETFTKERKIWHPSTAGYAMTKRTAADEDNDFVPIEATVFTGKPPPPDGYTDDDPSVMGDEDVIQYNRNDVYRDTSRTRPGSGNNINGNSKPRNKAWDSHYINPIFFGYTAQSVGERDKELKQEKVDLKARETRAINRAKATRSVAIDALEKTTSAQARARQEKIDKLKEKYAAAQAKRESEFARNERELLAPAFAIFEVRCICFFVLMHLFIVLVFNT